jgi:hypothetical protein
MKKIKQILLAGAASTLLSMPVVAAEMGTDSMTGTSGVTGTTKTMPTGTSNAPATGPNSTAIPEVPAGGTASGTMNGETTGSTMGTSTKDGGASTTDLQQKLTTKGYTSIMPAESAGAATSGETRFNATNSAGQKVQVTVNANTGAIVSEKPIE